MKFEPINRVLMHSNRFEIISLKHRFSSQKSIISTVSEYNKPNRDTLHFQEHLNNNRLENQPPATQKTIPIRSLRINQDKTQGLVTSPRINEGNTQRGSQFNGISERHQLAVIEIEQGMQTSDSEFGNIVLQMKQLPTIQIKSLSNDVICVKQCLKGEVKRFILTIPDLKKQLSRFSSFSIENKDELFRITSTAKSCVNVFYLLYQKNIQSEQSRLNFIKREKQNSKSRLKCQQSIQYALEFDKSRFKIPVKSTKMNISSPSSENNTRKRKAHEQLNSEYSKKIRQNTVIEKIMNTETYSEQKRESLKKRGADVSNKE